MLRLGNEPSGLSDKLVIIILFLAATQFFSDKNGNELIFCSLFLSMIQGSSNEIIGIMNL